MRALNDWCSTRESRELRTGRADGPLHARVVEEPQYARRRTPATLAALAPAPSWLLVRAAAAQRMHWLREASLAFAFGWAENMVQAALKAVPLGQSAGQRILAALVEAIPPTVSAPGMDDEARQAFAPMLAILRAARDAVLRLFRS